MVRPLVLVLAILFGFTGCSFLRTPAQTPVTLSQGVASGTEVASPGNDSFEPETINDNTAIENAVAYVFLSAFIAKEFVVYVLKGFSSPW